MGTSYRIGTVCRLTGIPPETLRSWEARHGLVTPRRTAGGFRLYGEEDLERIRLVRTLTLSGHAVGTLAGLEMDELRRRHGMDPAAAVGAAIGLVDGALQRLGAADPSKNVPGALGVEPAVAELRTARAHLENVVRSLG